MLIKKHTLLSMSCTGGVFGNMIIRVPYYKYQDSEVQQEGFIILASVSWFGLFRVYNYQPIHN